PTGPTREPTVTTPFQEAKLRARTGIGLLWGAGASRPLGLPLMTDLLPPQFREAIGDADQEVIFDIAFNWSMAQHPTSLDFELLYTAVDALASLQSQDLLALAFVPHQKDRGFVFKGPT